MIITIVVLALAAFLTCLGIMVFIGALSMLRGGTATADRLRRSGFRLRTLANGKLPKVDASGSGAECAGFYVKSTHDGLVITPTRSLSDGAV